MRELSISPTGYSHVQSSILNMLPMSLCWRKNNRLQGAAEYSTRVPNDIFTENKGRIVSNSWRENAPVNRAITFDQLEIVSFSLATLFLDTTAPLSFPKIFPSTNSLFTKFFTVSPLVPVICLSVLLTHRVTNFYP